MAAAEQDFISNAGVTTADAKYAAALLLHHLRAIKNAIAGVNDSLAEANHNWLGADGPGAGNTAIQADLTAAIDPHSLALLEDFANARAAGVVGVTDLEAGKHLAWTQVNANHHNVATNVLTQARITGFSLADFRAQRYGANSGTKVDRN